MLKVVFVPFFHFMIKNIHIKIKNDTKNWYRTSVRKIILIINKAQNIKYIIKQIKQLKYFSFFTVKDLKDKFREKYENDLHVYLYVAYIYVVYIYTYMRQK